MVQDVYAGDDPTTEPPATCTARFQVIADGDPSTVSRVAQQIAFSNEVPREFHAALRTDGIMEIHATVIGATAPQCEYIRRKLAQLSVVIAVDLRFN